MHLCRIRNTSPESQAVSPTHDTCSFEPANTTLQHMQQPRCNIEPEGCVAPSAGEAEHSSSALFSNPLCMHTHIDTHTSPGHANCHPTASCGTFNLVMIATLRRHNSPRWTDGTPFTAERWRPHKHTHWRGWQQLQPMPDHTLEYAVCGRHG